MLAAFGIAVVAVLAVTAFFLHDTQTEQREDLRARYADRVVVSSALIDSLFAVAFSGQTDELSARLGRDRPSTADVDARVRESTARWAFVVDARGRVIARSARAPSGAELQRLASARFVRRALRPGGYGLGDIEGETVPSAVGFAGPSGVRAYVSGGELEGFRTFLQGTLAPLPGVRLARAYVLDGNGRRLGAAAQAIPILPRTPNLLAALRQGPSGTFESDTGTRYFAAEPIRGSSWRLVVTVPERVLYASASGVGRALPWIILALTAIALAGMGLLLRRLLRTTTVLTTTNAELADANAELARSNADLEQFAYVASHDLSEPLRTVAGFSQLLGKRYRGELDAEADLFIDHMTAGVDRMQHLIDDLLLYSRVGRAPIGRAHVDLDEVMDEVLHAIEPTTREQAAQITSDELPTVVGEHGQLRQVLQNLLVNAMKFTAPDVTPRVHVGAERDGGCWRITVRDNGIGVPDGQHETIFKMFGRLHPGDHYPGTGIGLALVKRIVERHGGRIWVERGPGGGSVFAFTLPDRARLGEPLAPREGASA
jgi:signal transduction histidine kinase